MSEPEARILVVGATDHCRAPLVAAVLQDALGGRPIAVASAGTGIGDGMAVCADARAKVPLAQLAATTAARAVPVSAAAVDDADLVLTVDRAQRTAVNRLAPGRQAKVFTLAEAAALATRTPRRREPVPLRADTVAELAGELHARRGSVDPLPVDVPRRGLRHRPIVDCDPDDVPDAHLAASDAHAWALDRGRALARLLGGAIAALPQRQAVGADH